MRSISTYASLKEWYGEQAEWYKDRIEFAKEQVKWCKKHMPESVEIEQKMLNSYRYQYRKYLRKFNTCQI